LTKPAEKTLVANIFDPNRRGLAYGWYNFAVGVGTLPASLLFGAIYQAFSSLAAFTWGAALVLSASLILMAVSSGRQS